MQAVFHNNSANFRVQDIKNKDAAIRSRSLSIFRIFTKHISQEDSMWFCYLYLADSNRDVRRKAKDIIILDGLLDFLPPTLKMAKENMGSRRVCIHLPKK
jgi:hypothetical protein